MYQTPYLLMRWGSKLRFDISANAAWTIGLSIAD